MVVGFLFRRITFIIGGLILLAVLGIAFGHVLVGGLVETGVESIGPLVAKVPMEVQDVDTSLLGGSVTIQGFRMGNPEGFKSDRSAFVGRAHVDFEWGTLFSSTVVVPEVEIDRPELTVEYAKGATNIGTIIDQVSSTEKSERTYRIGVLRISDPEVRVAGLPAGQTVDVELPDIELTDLGADGGLSPAELVVRILKAIQEAVLGSVSGQLPDQQLEQLRSEVLQTGQDFLEQTRQEVQKRVQDLLGTGGDEDGGAE